MTANELESLCILAYLARRDSITLTFPKGVKQIKGFPRGELLSVNPEGLQNYSFDVMKMLAWLKSKWGVSPSALLGEA